MDTLAYTVILEQAEEGNWGAYVPDLPTVVGGASTRHELEALMREAIALHIADLKLQGLPIAAPTSTAIVIGVAA